LYVQENGEQAVVVVVVLVVLLVGDVLLVADVEVLWHGTFATSQSSSGT
jgi:hypothetical protein